MASAALAHACLRSGGRDVVPEIGRARKVVGGLGKRACLGGLVGSGHRRGERPVQVVGRCPVFGQGGPAAVALQVGNTVQRGRVAPVRVTAFPGQQVVVEHLAHEGVTEGVALVVGDQEMAVDGFTQGGSQLTGTQVDDGGQQVVGHGQASRRGGTDQVLGRGRQAAQTGQDRFAQSRRHRAVGAGGGQLQGDVGVAAGALDRLADQLAVPVGDGIQQSLEVVVGECSEVQATDTGGALPLGQGGADRVARAQLVRPKRQDHQHRRGTEACQDGRQQVDRGCVGPVDVFDDEDQCRIRGSFEDIEQR